MYSDANYDLLGKIIARVTLSSFEEQLEEMTKICQMKDTFAKERGDALFFKNLYPQFMEGWREGRRGKFIHSFMVRNPAQNPSQGIISTPKDMIRWARCLHGNLNENDLLSPASYKKMMTSYVDIDHRWKNLGYGYGVQVTKVFGSTEISHSGIVPGFKTTLIYYPEEKIAALVMENLTLKNNPREFAIHDGVRKIIIDRLIAPPPKEVFMKR
jgi:CubicO group peptidase (beta-lactamase class C family)